MRDFLRCVILLCGTMLLFSPFSVGMAQHSTTHTDVYTAKDGLAQNAVSDMLKDDDGFLWLVSKGGLSRFDGYDFRNFKASSEKLNRSVSNQFHSILKDGSGCLWLLNDIGQVLRFDPKIEEFSLFPPAEANRGADYFSVASWTQTSVNEIWLVGANAKGAMRVSVDSLSTVSMSRFCPDQECEVRMVKSGPMGRRWLLTDKGVWTMNETDTVPVEYSMHGVGTVSAFCMEETPNELLFSCADGQICKYEKNPRRFTNVRLETREDLIYVSQVDEAHYCVVGENGGFWVLKLSDDKIIERKNLKGFVDKCWTDGDKLLFRVRGHSATYQFDKKSLTLSSTHDVQTDSEVLLDDTMGVVWHSSENEGFAKTVSFNESFRQVLCDPKSTHYADNDVVATVEDRQKRLWVATRSGELRLYGGEGVLLGRVDCNGVLNGNGASFPTISCLYQDSKDAMWVATEEELLCLNETTSHNRFSVRHCTPTDAAFAPLSLQVGDMLEDSKGRLWLATLTGGLHLLVFDENGCRFIHKGNLFKDNYPPTVEQSHTLMEDRDGNIWLGSGEGLTIFSSTFDAPEEVRFLFYNTENTGLVNSCVYDIYQDANDVIWVASYGGGLFRMKNKFVLFQTPEFEVFSKDNNLFPSDLVLDITEDNLNNLWVLSEEAIVRFVPSTQSAESFGQFRGFRSDYFSGRRIVRRYSGDLVAATNVGFYTFNPSLITPADYSPRVVFTRFLIFNKEQDVRDEKSPVRQDVNTLQSISLRHSESVFSIGYAALDYRFPEHVQYAYKLEPFEAEWNYVGTQRLASYTNLPSGTYRFVVKSTNSEGVWCDNVREIQIIVQPTFWETGWAYALYALLILAVVGAVVALYTLRTRIKMDREVADTKLQFFTDVSHELRTPLTLISAPLENVLERGRVDETDRKQLEVVKSNADRMLRMMNQILDFRKMQSNKMRLRVEQTRLGEFVEACCANFSKTAENRNIHFSVTDKSLGATFWVDRDKVDTLLFNLLSNAFKFTAEGKHISVEVSVSEGRGIITVSDEGCGMPKDKLSEIFDRYTTLQEYSLTRQSGTGIGLSLVKEIADLHKATIRVQSEPGKGSTFEVAFLPGNEHFGSNVEVRMEDTKQDAEAVAEPHHSHASQSILVVEDNVQMREFLSGVLRKNFIVVEAANGVQGYEAAVREQPDFILTDVMMPEMDGIEMTKRLRAEERASHIPIVLLTAKTDLQSKIECMKIGANDYITKPFSMAYLEARINNILEERKKWQEKYRNDLLHNVTFATEKSEETETKEESEIPQSEGPDVLGERDDELMRRFVALIEANLSKSAFSAEDAEAALKISRWHLLNKVKSLVGMTPNEFIRETRLAHAARMIDEGELNMTQIAYSIGMSDSRYFSRCFKQKFGITPTEYKNRPK